MTYKVLSLKWRPKSFNEVVGQNHITIALKNAISLERVAHAFTFSGPRGVGKTTTARILAKELNSVDDLDNSFDIIEMDGASNRGIDEIRNLNSSVHYAPSHGKYKIYIIDEVHMLTKEAFNALLKTLEEPPSHIVFILCTTELHKMPTTILSRTQRFDFRRISCPDIVSKLSEILVEERIKYEQSCLQIIAEKAEGSMRDALSLLDQMICLCENELTIDLMKEHLGIIEDDTFLKLINLIGQKDSQKIFSVLEEILSTGISIDEFVKSLNKYLSNLLISSSNQKIELEELDLLRIIDMTLKFQGSLKKYSQQKIALEVLFLKLSHLDKMLDISQFINDNVDMSDKVTIPKKKTELKVKKEINRLESNLNLQDQNKKDIIPENKSEIKSNDIKEKVKDTPILQKENVEIDINLDLIKSKWREILNSIQKQNSKTAGFLEDSDINELTDDILNINVNNVTEFAFNGLLNDVSLIESIFFKKLKVNLKVKLTKGTINKNKIIKKNKNDQKDHPLFMDVLNKFKGEVLR